MPERPIRAIKIEAYLWDAAKEKAAVEGRAVSEVVRELLAKWVTRPPRAPRG